MGVARVHRKIQKLSLPIQKLTTLASALYRGAALGLLGERGGAAGALGLPQRRLLAFCAASCSVHATALTIFMHVEMARVW